MCNLWAQSTLPRPEMDENKKFIKLSLSPQRVRGSSFELLKDSSKVFWRNETPYAFCNLCPEIATDVEYKPLKAKIVDTLRAARLSAPTWPSTGQTRTRGTCPPRSR